MRNSFLAIFAVAVLGTLTGCDFEDLAASTRVEENFHYDYSLKPGGSLIVENRNGSVEIYGWDKDSVSIDGTKYASTKDLLGSIRIDIVNSPDSIQIRTIAPNNERRENRGAKYTIHVPKRTRLDRIESSNGGLRAEDVTGDARMRSSNGGVRFLRFRGNVDARTSNGPVSLEDFNGSAILATSNGSITAQGVNGQLDAYTSNGSINASVRDLDANRALKLRTSNGSVNLTLESGLLSDVTASTSNSGITLRLPPGINAKLKAHTSNSSVSADVPLQTVIEKRKSTLEANLGSGGPLIDLSTSNGPIRIQRN